MFKSLIIIMQTFIILFLTNPGEEKFISYYEKKIEKVQGESKGDWKEDLVLTGKKLNVKMNVKRENKVIYSIYSINFLGEEERYLGIATLFFSIDKAEKMVEDIKEEVKQ